MEWNDAARWGWAVVLLINGVGYWLLWSLNKKFTPREDCFARHALENESAKALNKSLTALESRSTEAEARLDHMPPTATVHELQLSVEQLRGEVRTLKAENAGIKDILLRVENNVTLLVRGHMKE